MTKTLAIQDKNHETARRFLTQGFDRQDLRFLDSVSSPDFTIDPAFPGVPADLDGFKTMVAGYAQGFTDYAHEIADVIGSGDLVAVRGTFHASHTGDLFGLAATGRRVVLPFVVVLRFDGALVCGLAAYADHTGMMQELGAGPDGDV